MRFRLSRIFTRPWLGRRGSVLLVLGSYDLVQGWALLNPTVLGQTSSAAAWREHYAPGWLWGSMWIVVGVVLLVQMFMRRDMIAYSCAIAIKVLYGTNAIMSWAFGGVMRGWLSGLVWLAFAGMVAVISGWRENADQWPPERRDIEDRR